MHLEKFEELLLSVPLKEYRAKYSKIKLVEMDLPPSIQCIGLMYEIYGKDREFLSFDKFYEVYLAQHKQLIEDFRTKITMCEDCFYRGLPARIYRTWASIITQIHAGYVAESVFGEGTVTMSPELDHQGIDFQVKYKDRIINYQVKKKTFSREVRKEKISKKIIVGIFEDIVYNVPSSQYFDNPLTKKGVHRKPYSDFMNNKSLRRMDNGFIVFTPYIFEVRKQAIDNIN